ncbi:glutamine amidotransferase-related protein [Oceanobacillus sp. FSL H7-0719]
MILLIELQFHPESIATPTGKQMIENFLHLLGKELVHDETLS